MDTLDAAHPNIRAWMHHRVDGAPIPAKRVRAGDMMIVGAEFAIEAVKAAFFVHGDQDQ